MYLSDSGARRAGWIEVNERGWDGNGVGKVRCLGRCWARNARLREPWHFSETTQEGRSALPFVVSPDAQPRAPRTGPGQDQGARERGGAHHCCVCVRGSDQLSAASQPALPARPSHALHGASGRGRPTGGFGVDTPRVGIGPASGQLACGHLNNNPWGVVL